MKFKKECINPKSSLAPFLMGQGKQEDRMKKKAYPTLKQSLDACRDRLQEVAYWLDAMPMLTPDGEAMLDGILDTLDRTK